MPGQTAVTALKTRMSDPANFAPGQDPSLWTGPGARDAAVTNGNSTMEHTVGDQATESYVNGQKLVWDQSKGIWVESSSHYANQVGSQYGTMDPATGLPISGPNSGKPVTVYVSENANPNSIYFSTEKPLLQSYGVNIVEVMVPAPAP
jgi:hypothetical protein